MVPWRMISRVEMARMSRWQTRLSTKHSVGRKADTLESGLWYGTQKHLVISIGI